MKRLLPILLLSIGIHSYAQSVSDNQMLNARATGYAIVAARNPGKSFSILMIPWDGINTLEYNANNQINGLWHPQAVVKGNYFNQYFDGTNFSQYSSVVLSQAEFDQYKSFGTQWWIVCSMLPAFSYAICASDAGNVGIGTATPGSKLEVNGDMRSNSWYPYGSTSNDFYVDVEPGTRILRTRNYNTSSPNILATGIHTGSGYFEGNVGIGTISPSEKLSVNGNIRSKKLIITQTGWSDYVFDSVYQLQPLTELERFIKTNKHLPDIPSAKEVEKEGIDVGDNQALLLKKIEELTLYIIETNKKMEQMKKTFQDQIIELKKQNQSLVTLTNSQ